MQKEVIEITSLESSNLIGCEETLTDSEIPTIPKNLSFSEFFYSYLIPNKPCLIHNITKDWPCINKWIKNNSLNTEYFQNNLTNVEVPISDCKKREFNVQKKSTMKLFDYLDYWEKFKKSSKEMDCLYLKDWHFMKEFPQENIYRVPYYFASDWLNEYYDNNPELNDDYRFVYIGPKGSWTPLHVDVFTSFSWSVNICGRKKWILFPPGAENSFRDTFGTLAYDIGMSLKTPSDSKEKALSFEIIQEEGQGLFVPSGWHHQVWNLEDSISINHNWINGCNIHYVWSSLKKNLSDVMAEISDCKDMENWISQCQLVLSASFGFDYNFFYSFLVSLAKTRIDALKNNKDFKVYGNWYFGENLIRFDLKRILSVLNLLVKDENFIDVTKTGKLKSLNHALEFLDSLNTFLNSE